MSLYITYSPFAVERVIVRLGELSFLSEGVPYIRFTIAMGKPDYCAIKGCHNKPRDVGRFGRVVKLHRLPKQRHLRTAWLRAISRKDYKPSSYTQVCSDHFPRGEGRTAQNPVPTLHLPHKPEKELKPRTTNNSSKSSWLTVEPNIKPEDMEDSQDQVAKPKEFESDIHS